LQKLRSETTNQGLSNVLNLKNSLLVGASVSAFAVFAAPAFAQDNGGSNEPYRDRHARAGMTPPTRPRPSPFWQRCADQGHRLDRFAPGAGPDRSSFVAQQYGADTAN